MPALKYIANETSLEIICIFRVNLIHKSDKYNDNHFARLLHVIAAT